MGASVALMTTTNTLTVTAVATTCAERRGSLQLVRKTSMTPPADHMACAEPVGKKIVACFGLSSLAIPWRVESGAGRTPRLLYMLRTR
jgi:hypothetical protein